MIFIYDNKEVLLDEIATEDLLNADDDFELNGKITAIISYPYKLHNKEASYFGYYYEGEYLRYKITDKKKEKGVMTITGIHIFFDDLKGNVIRDKRPTNTTALSAGQTALEGTGWTVTSTATGTNSTTFYFVSSLDAFYDVLKKWRCEFKLELQLGSNGITKKNVHLADNVSEDYGKWFEYGDKLLKVVAEEKHSEIYTAFIGRGKGVQLESGGYGRKILFDNVSWLTANGDPIDKPLGQDYIEFKDMTALYGYPNGNPRIGVVDFDDIEDENLLIKSTYEFGLENSRPKLQLEADAISDNKVVIGELCSIIRPDLDIRYKTKIFRLKRNLLKNVQTFEFGDKIVFSSAERLKADQQKTKESEVRIMSVMEAALSEITQTYWGTDGYNYDIKVGNEYGLPAGFYSFNKPIDEDPTKVTYVGGGQILISNQKDPNGEWIWKTAMTPDGIVGSSIITNSISVNKVTSDFGSNLDLSSNKSITSKVSKDEYDIYRNIINRKITIIEQNADSIKLAVESKGKYRNILSNSDWFIDNGAYAVRPDGFKRGTLVYDSTYGTLTLRASEGIGKYRFFLPIETPRQVDIYTLWLGSLGLSEHVRNVTFALCGDMQYTASSVEISQHKTGNSVLNKQFYLRKWADNRNKEALKILRIDFETTSSRELQYVRFRPEQIALVEGEVPTLSWDMTYLATNNSKLEMTQKSILAQVGDSYLEIKNFGKKFDEEVSKITLKGSQIELNGNTIVSSDFKVTGDMIVGGVLNAGNVRVTNLDASAITTGTIKGHLGSWDLKSGCFETNSTSGFKTSLYNGSITQFENGIERIRMTPQGLQFYSKDGEGNHIGVMMSSEYSSTGKFALTLGHSYPDNNPAFINIGYLNTSTYNSTGKRTYDPYIFFDKWNSISDIGRSGYPIKVIERSQFLASIYVDASIEVKDYIKFGIWNLSSVSGLASAIGGAGFKIVDGAGYGFGFGANFTIWRVKGNTWESKIVG